MMYWYVFLLVEAVYMNAGASAVHCKSSGGTIGGVGRIACMAPSDVIYMKWFKCDGKTCKEILVFFNNTSKSKVITPGKLNQRSIEDGNATLIINNLQKVDEALYRVEMHGKDDMLEGCAVLSVQENPVFVSTSKPRQNQARSVSIGTSNKPGAVEVLVVAVMCALIVWCV